MARVNGAETEEIERNGKISIVAGAGQAIGRAVAESLGTRLSFYQNNILRDVRCRGDIRQAPAYGAYMAKLTRCPAAGRSS